MPSLTIPNTFSANTAAQSAQVNANFNAVATLLNSTKLDNTNIQTGGLATANYAAASVTKAKLASDVVDNSTLALDGGNALIVKDGGITLAKLAAAVANALVPTGAVSQYEGTAAPTGWLLCDGSLVSRTTYAALYAVIGNTHGSGDGSTTFNLPDRRGMFVRGLMPLSSVNCSGSASGNNVTATGHGFNHSGVRVRVTGTPVTGLSTGTTYYVIYIDANTVAFATSHANAISATKISISGTAGSMAIQQWVDADASSRSAAAPGGNSGQNVGSFEEDDITQHSHTSLAATTGSGSTGVLGGTGSIFTGAATGNAGGNETRPINAYTNFIIKT